MSLFERRNKEQFTNSLADYTPGGILFASKTVQNSNFRRLLRGMACELFNANGLLKAYNDEYYPDKTVQFINEWESALGIPDDCFSGTGSLEERRINVLTKLASLGVQTAEDFEHLSSVFGVNVTVRAGIDIAAFPMEFPLLFLSQSQARFTIVVDVTDLISETFTYTFPFTFGTKELGIIKCLFNKLKPSNCNVIFRQV